MIAKARELCLCRPTTSDYSTALVSVGTCGRRVGLSLVLVSHSRMVSPLGLALLHNALLPLPPVSCARSLACQSHLQVCQWSGPQNPLKQISPSAAELTTLQRLSFSSNHARWLNIFSEAG